jgi:NaMN:DMB phosphoribosyltransferase
VHIDPSCARCLFLCTRSPETGHAICVNALANAIWPDGLPPHGIAALDMGLRLGEGTAAAMCIPILSAAAAVINEMVSLDKAIAS